jgi:hypothetical protein
MISQLAGCLKLISWSSGNSMVYIYEGLGETVFLEIRPVLMPLEGKAAKSKGDQLPLCVTWEALE